MKVVGKVLNLYKIVLYFLLSQIIALSLFLVGHHAQQAQQAAEPIAIVKYDNEGVNADGSYNWM